VRALLVRSCSRLPRRPELCSVSSVEVPRSALTNASSTVSACVRRTCHPQLYFNVNLTCVLYSNHMYHLSSVTMQQHMSVHQQTVSWRLSLLRQFTAFREVLPDFHRA
jgi:hypothetical protein